MIFSKNRTQDTKDKSATDTKNVESNWIGWVYFAGILMTLAGGFQIIAGLTALLRQSYYLVGEQSLIAFNYATWGWIHAVLGFVIFSAGVAVMSGSLWARIVGVIVSIVAIIAGFAFMAAYPLWVIAIIITNLLIIYALVVHGAEAVDSVS